MENFVYQAPTKIVFGKNTHREVGKIIKEYGFHRVLLHYGGKSLKKSGAYDEITQSLEDAGIWFCELPGAEPNPKLSLVKTGAQLAKQEGVELVLAAGGGSVIDSAKAIAIGAKNEGDLWRFWEKKDVPQTALSVGTVLTLAASGSEMSSSAVLTNEETGEKRGLNTQLNRPLFSVLNPELTFSAGRFQTGCGIVDIMMHTLERYFANSPAQDLTDRVAEGLLTAVVSAGKKVMSNPRDYEARATLMWAGSLSHNDLTGLGRKTFMPCHQIEHALSGRFDEIAHGAGLSVLFPAWAKYVYKLCPARFCQLGERVFGLDANNFNPEENALAAIYALENYFAEIGMPTRLDELGEFSFTEDNFLQMARQATFYGARTLDGYKSLDEGDIVNIFHLAR